MNKDQSKFKVLQGGRSDPDRIENQEFISAYVTNTRLMGVTCIYIHFKSSKNDVLCDLHQFFYYDAEEYGLENYQSLFNPEDEELQQLENSLIGGLGAEKISISLREAEFLLQEYARFNRSRSLSLPKSYPEYRFLLESSLALSPKEVLSVMNKQCVEIQNAFEAINYFLMRAFSGDFSAAAYLAEKGVEISLFPELVHATFLKNSIHKTDRPDVYRNESLLEAEDVHYLAVTEVRLRDFRISDFQRTGFFSISPCEAALLLVRPEFISVYTLNEKQPLSLQSTPLTATAMVHRHERGTLYMLFHPDNHHVAKQNYRLDEDVLGIYYVSDSGQLLAVSYTEKEIQLLEQDLRNSPIYDKLCSVSRYEFHESVLYEFIESGYSDFSTFVDMLTFPND